MQKQASIKSLLERIEKDAADEFDQLVDIGASYFSTPELLRLKGRWEEAYSTFKQLHRLLLIVGVSSPAWLLLSFPFGLLELERLAYFIMGLFPLTFMIFIAGNFLLKKKYGSRGFLEYVGSIIDEELRNRSLLNKTPRRNR